MSSPEIQRGLLANCVAARVQVLADPLHRKVCWWLQKASWEPGGLDQIAIEVMERWPERFATPSMVELGFGKRRVYSGDEVRRVRAEIPTDGFFDDSFSLRGERDGDDYFSGLGVPDEEKQGSKSCSKDYPTSYPAAVFVEKCLEAARGGLAKFLFEELCLDPAVEFNSRALWYCPRWVETLAEMHDLQAAKAAGGASVTQIGATVGETLDYALAERGLVVIEGVARTGKTFSVKAWCDAHPGQARYVQVPSSNDDMGFFRAVADSLRQGTSHAYKAHELRRRIEDVLQAGNLLLVLDEGHYLWPQRNMRKAVPHRINWMLTQLVNMGVPVAVVTTPQFTKSQEALVQSGGWSSEQLVGRIMHYQRLPDSLGEEDLEAVARYWLPGGDDKAIRLLITYSQSSEKYLQGIESLVRRARFLARKDGREQPTFQDVAAALKEGVVPSDNALAAALSTARGPGRRKPVGRPLSSPARAVCIASERAMQPTEKTVFTPPVRDTGGAVLST